jgi:hypothetical protein
MAYYLRALVEALTYNTSFDKQIPQKIYFLASISSPVPIWGGRWEGGVFGVQSRNVVTSRILPKDFDTRPVTKAVT